MKAIQWVLSSMATWVATIMFAVNCFGAIPGDADGSGTVDLQDVITAIQVCAGMNPADVDSEADVNNDGKIGLEEAVFVLAQIAEPQKGRAVLGPLSGAEVRAYRLKDMKTPVYTTTTDADGYFDSFVTGINQSEYILVSVSGGEDTDADNDGEPDASPTPNAGTIHALMTVSEFNAGGFNVSALTDIAWQFTKNLVGQVENSDLGSRLNALAGTFIAEDLSGDDTTDAADFLKFNPSDDQHKEKLNFDFQHFFTENADGHSIIDCFHEDLTDVLPVLLDEKFGSRLTLHPGVGVLYDKVKLELSVFGRGSVTSDIGGIDFDSERTEDSGRTDPAEDVSVAFFEKDASGNVTLTAAPVPDTEILSWDGCDRVSEDKTECVCNLRTDHLVSVSFGYKETILQEGVTLTDLSNAGVIVSSDQVTLNVTASIGDTDMMAVLEALKSGDVVLGSDDGGFLRKVLSTQKIADDNYILTTEDVSLEEVIAQGTGTFSKEMTHGDLAEDDASGSGRQGTRGFKTPENVRLLPSDDPNDPVFRIEIGDPKKRDFTGSLSYPTDDPVTFVTGTVDVRVNVDAAVSYKLASLDPGVEYFRFIPKITVSEDLEVTFEKKAKWDKKKPLKSLTFGKITFSIGPVPVIIIPRVDIYLGINASAGGKISTSIKLTQELRAGVRYHRNSGFKKIGKFTHTKEFTPPTAEVEAEIEPYVEVSPSMRIYGVMGPSMSLKGSLILKGETGTSVYENDECSQGIDFTAKFRFEASWKWDIVKAKKLGDWVADMKFGGDISAKDIDISQWNVGGTCDDVSRPHMKVEGDSVSESVERNSNTILTKNYTVRNTGDLNMDWELSYEEDGVVSATPESGTLEKGESVIVTVSVNTGAIGTDITDYTNEVEFINKFNKSSDEGWGASAINSFTSLFDGSADRSIYVVMEPPSLVAPVMAQPQMAKNTAGKVIPSVVNLSWSYPDAQTRDYVEGYVLYQTTPDPDDPGSPDVWHEIASITDPDKTGYQAAKLLPESVYYFSVMAYASLANAATSEMVSVTTPVPDLVKPVGRVIGMSSRYTAGNTVFCTVSGWHGGELSELGFTVLNDDAEEMHKETWNVSGSYVTESHSFPTSGWSPGTYDYTLRVKDGAGTVRDCTGFFELGESEAATPSGSTTTNGLGMTFSLIPAGTFMMGSPEDEPGRDSDETRHQVTLTQPFYLQTTEVTQGQWEAVMGSNPSSFSSCGDDCPVEKVSWNDVQDFITEMNKRGEGRYRLPTEAEWEYAARAGNTTAFANGGITETGCGHDPNLNAMGWYCGNSDVTYGGCYDTSSLGGPSCAGTHPVAQKQANAWGLYDMSGNVYEWCHDWYDSDYPTGSVTDPTGPGTGSNRVLRGGSWLFSAGSCRTASRDWVTPGFRFWDYGFRLVLLPGQ